MRVVITGGPSVGKTTIISGLANSGFPVVEEQATKIIKEGVFLPWVDRISFQEEVLRRQLQEEAKLRNHMGTAFLDRGAFDGEAYYQYDKLEPPSIFKTLDANRYDLALLIEPLPFFDNNEVRRENLDFTYAITEILENCYAQRGIPIIRIPAMPAQKRVDFVLLSVSIFRSELYDCGQLPKTMPYFDTTDHSLQSAKVLVPS